MQEIRAAKGICSYATADVRSTRAVEAASGRGRKRIWAGGAAPSITCRGEISSRAQKKKSSPNAFAAVVGIVLHQAFVHCTQALGERRWIAAGKCGQVTEHVHHICIGELRFGILWFHLATHMRRPECWPMLTSLAIEWARYNIRLNAIAPGPFPTEGAWCTPGAQQRR